MSVLEILTVVLLSLQEFLTPGSQHVLKETAGRRSPSAHYFDVQAHRGGRGSTVENLLPSFAWSLIDGATTLELDNGVTKDGVVVVWHDEEIQARKCQDTLPVFPDDPDFPYVGKNIANLTLAQLKALDCGSKRQDEYPEQLTYPGARISTLQELFDFVECADPKHQMLWNIESKVDAVHPNKTTSVEEFVDRQYEVFAGSAYKNSITYQSFDWRTLIEMKRRDPTITTSALVDDETAYIPDGSASLWLAGLNPLNPSTPKEFVLFNASTPSERVAQAAWAIGADILSPSAESYLSPTADPNLPGFSWFTTPGMVREARRLGLAVKPWTVNRLNIVDRLVEWGVDGIITDYPSVVRRWAQQRGMPIAPKYPKQRVLACLEQHMKIN